ARSWSRSRPSRSGQAADPGRPGAAAPMEHRYGEVELTLLDVDGTPLAGASVTVEQQRHAFAFGNIAFDLVRMVGGPDPAATARVEGFGSEDRKSTRLNSSH